MDNIVSTEDLKLATIAELEVLYKEASALKHYFLCALIKDELKERRTK